LTKILKESQLLKIVETGIHKLKRVPEFNYCHFFPVEKNGKDVYLKVRNKKTREIINLIVSFVNVTGEENEQTTAYTNGKGIRLNFYLIANNAEDPFEKCVNSFIHEMVHVYQLFILNIPMDSLVKQNGGHEKTFEVLRESVNNSLLDTIKKNTQTRTKKFINPSVSAKAAQLFEDFNHYPAEKVKSLSLPIGPNSTLAKLGKCEGIEYLSDKMIFKTDKKTGKRKKRTYTHSFTECGKSPELYSNEDGSLLIIYSAKNPIEVTEAGII